MAKRIWTVLILLTVLIGLGAARADREVRLPESKYRIDRTGTGYQLFPF